MSISHSLLILTIPLYVYISLIVSGDPQRGTFAALVVGGMLCAAVVHIWRSRKIPVPEVLAWWMIGVLGTVTVLPLYKTGFNVHALFGSSMEWGTVASMALFLLAFVVGVIYARAGSRVLLGLELLGSVGAVGAVLIIEGIIPSALIADSWIQLSVLFCAAAVIAAARSDAEPALMDKIMHAALAVASITAFFALFSPAVASIGIISGVIMTLALRDHQSPPFVSGAVALIILVSILFGMRSSAIPLSSDGRPSFHSTALVVGPLFMEHPLQAMIGTGPHTFPYTWTTYRPTDVNATPVWMLIPRYSYSALSTVVVEYGLFGMFALLGFLIFPLKRVYRRIAQNADADRREIAVGAAALFLMLSACVTPLGTPLLVLAATLCGMCARSTPMLRRGDPRRVLVALTLLMVLLGAGLIWVSIRQIRAASYDARGIALLRANQTADAIVLLDRATSLWGSSEYENDAAAAYLRQGVAKHKSGAPQEDAQRDMNAAMVFAENAAQKDRSDFSRWLFSASLYLALYQNGGIESLERANFALDHAEAIAPTRPDVFYTRALILVAQNDVTGALAQLKKAVELKPDYEDALRLQLRITPVR